MKKRLLLRRKLGLSFAVLAVLIFALLTFSLYRTVRVSMRQDIRERLHDAVAIAALQVDAEAHSTLTTPAHEGNATYLQIRHTLQQMRDAGKDIHFVYTMRKDPQERIVFVVDAETDPKEIAHLDDVYDDASPLLKTNFATLDRPIVEEDFYTDKWGTWLTGYAPFYGSHGRREGVLGMDIRAGEVLAHERKFLFVALVVFGASVPLALLLGWLLGRRIAAPIGALTASAERIAGGDLSSGVDVSTKDEIGDLAASFNYMTSKLKHTLESLQLEVAEHKRTQESLLASERLAALGQFSGSISHELRNPLGVIDSSAYYLKTKLKDADDKVHEHIDRIKSSVDIATAVIQSVLDLTRMKEPKRDKLDLVSILSETIASSNVPATVIVVHDFPGKEVFVNADREQLRMAFNNIVTNAVGAMDGKGSLTVEFHSTADGKAQISIADTGPGIAPENLEKIYQPFFSTRAKGIGFGLSIAKMVVDKHCGTIEAKSELGEGATFTICLPLGKDEHRTSNVQSRQGVK